MLHRKVGGMTPFGFGLISDIQYADIEDASNFSGTEHRGYREAAHAAMTSLQTWSTHPASPLFVAQLGDLIDGQNAGTYGQGLALKEPQSSEALNRVLSAWESHPIKTFHAIGNHELYNFSWEELRSRLNGLIGGAPHQISDPHTGQFYYSVSISVGWRLIVLNCYEMNVIRGLQPETQAEAARLLRSHNPNYGQPVPFDFFAGLEEAQMRYVPFNGGLGARQLAWLDEELRALSARGEKALICGHLPLSVEAGSPRNVAFDADDALTILRDHREKIAAYFAGHRHRGGYARDSSGIHHLTVQAPLTHGACAATAFISEKGLDVQGEGAHRSHLMSLDHLK